MNRHQSTILTLLLVAAGIHIWLDPAAQSNFKQILTITPNNWRQLGANTISGYLLYLLSLAGLLLLSDYAPKAALWIAILVLTGALLVNYKPITAWVNNTVQAMGGTIASGGKLANQTTGAAGGKPS